MTMRIYRCKYRANVGEGGVEKSIEMEKEKFFLSNDDKICLKGKKGKKWRRRIGKMEWREGRGFLEADNLRTRWIRIIFPFPPIRDLLANFESARRCWYLDVSPF